MKTKITIVTLLVVITASIVSIANHASVLRPASVPIKNEISVNPSSLIIPIESYEASSNKKNEVHTDYSEISVAPFIALTVDGVTYKTQATSTQTILEVMRTLEKTTDFSFKGTDFAGMGFFVSEVNHKKSADGYYWMLYLNMLATEKGASQVYVTPGDKILWRYEKSGSNSY